MLPTGGHRPGRTRALPAHRRRGPGAALPRLEPVLQRVALCPLPGCAGPHDAARGSDPRDFTWDDSLADPAGGRSCPTTTCAPENVVFRDGIAVALLDFEFAAPGRPVYDVAYLARLCVPPTTTSISPASAGGPPTGRHGFESSPTRTDWTGTAGRSCSPP